MYNEKKNGKKNSNSSLKLHVNTGKASVKKTLRDDTKIYSIPSAVTGIRQLDTNGGITLTERFKQKFNRV